MPIYDYKCNTCGTTFEYKQSMSESALTTCPQELCKSEKKGNGSVHRVVSKNIGLVFKGSGFYSTDYTNKGKEDTSVSPPTPAPACSSGECQKVADSSSVA
jgi:putative FmdB family regulatory protein